MKLYDKIAGHMKETSLYEHPNPTGSLRYAPDEGPWTSPGVEWAWRGTRVHDAMLKRVEAGELEQTVMEKRRNGRVYFKRVSDKTAADNVTWHRDPSEFAKTFNAERPDSLMFSPDGRAFSVRDLIEQFKDRPAKPLNPHFEKRLQRSLSTPYWNTNSGERVSPQQVLDDIDNADYREHKQRIDEADLSFPILVGEGDAVPMFDGAHRTAKHFQQKQLGQPSSLLFRRIAGTERQLAPALVASPTEPNTRITNDVVARLAAEQDKTATAFPFTWCNMKTLFQKIAGIVDDVTNNPEIAAAALGGIGGAGYGLLRSRSKGHGIGRTIGSTIIGGGIGTAAGYGIVTLFDPKPGRLRDQLAGTHGRLEVVTKDLNAAKSDFAEERDSIAETHRKKLLSLNWDHEQEIAKHRDAWNAQDFKLQQQQDAYNSLDRRYESMRKNYEDQVAKLKENVNKTYDNYCAERQYGYDIRRVLLRELLRTHSIPTDERDSYTRLRKALPDMYKQLELIEEASYKNKKK